MQVALVPLSSVWMSSNIHPDENLCNTAFNKKYLEGEDKPYDRSHEGAESSENYKDHFKENEYSDGDIIDLGNGEGDERSKEEGEINESNYDQGAR
ncbi:hypothetical protein O181_011161 [Austropuccinia psidii MF-1]|uniref:Uncharacterized protein n=1 Tax=Austropuccinia psidii MF-1 TaxID=1389203 RepID=A0A9Q3GL30_9BASI|nr:hypothetical protein [Austropuccinia psidii MF-1]